MISKRQNQIIKTLVEEYIETAQPVSSNILAEKYDFGICPSAIRIELQSLIKEGFLEQPHTSAGRVPTDKAYRLFVDNLLEDNGEEESIKTAFERMLKRAGDNDYGFASLLAKYLAENSSNFTAIHFYNEGLTLKEGLNEIFKEPEFEDTDFVSSFSNFLENFEKNIEKLDINSKIKIFIGKEVPIPGAKNITLICSTCNLPSHQGFISILGPKRMDYNKNIRLINSLNKVLEKLL